MARWLEVLSQYHFTITHQEGKKHQNADALSRLDHDQSGADSYNPDFPLESLPCRGCNKCRKMQESWSLFHEEVDCVVPMGKCHHHKCRRVQTRSMEKSGRTLITNEMEGQESNDVDSLNSRQTWFSGYSPEELHTMQKYDSDLASILESLEKGLKDDRDTASSFSPATRKLWLNWDNLILQDGVMYQRGL